MSPRVARASVIVSRSGTEYPRPPPVNEGGVSQGVMIRLPRLPEAMYQATLSYLDVIYLIYYSKIVKMHTLKTPIRTPPRY